MSRPAYDGGKARRNNLWGEQMQWWDLVPVALAALSLGCVAWGARELYHHHLASRDHRRRGLSVRW